MPSFLIATLALLLFPLFFPGLYLLYYIPFLAKICYKKTRLQAVVIAVLCGLIVDCFSSSFRLGMHTIPLVLTVLCCYPLKRQFFEDKFSTIPLLSFFFSICYSLIAAVFMMLFVGSLTFNFRWIITDCIEMAICDALYALILFGIPFQITHKLSKLRQYANRRKRDC